MKLQKQKEETNDKQPAQLTETKIENKEETKKDLVRKIHPKSMCKFRAMHKKYIIFNDDIMTKGIGSGLTPKKAWEDAYRKLKN